MQITSYEDLNIGKYTKILAIVKDENMEELDKQVKIITILNDMEEDEVLNLPINDYMALAQSSQFLAEPCTENLPRVADTYHIGGYVLVPVKDLKKVTTAQYIDFLTFSEDVDKYLAELLSCLLIPKGKKYNQDYDIVDVQNALKANLSVKESVSLSAFFFERYIQLVNSSLHYLGKEVKGMPKVMRKEFLRRASLTLNGDGSPM